jgi:hypothetical protein
VLERRLELVLIGLDWHRAQASEQDAFLFFFDSLREPLDPGLRVVVIVRDDGVKNTLDVGVVAFV